MRAKTLALAAFCCLAFALDAGAQQVPAITTTVSALVKTPPRTGQLINVSGYLDTSEQTPNLRDTDGNRRIALDFSRSTTPLSALGAGTTSSLPVLIVGQVQGIKDKGKPVLTVIGVIKLTP